MIRLPFRQRIINCGSFGISVWIRHIVMHIYFAKDQVAEIPADLDTYWLWSQEWISGLVKSICLFYVLPMRYWSVQYKKTHYAQHNTYHLRDIWMYNVIRLDYFRKDLFNTLHAITRVSISNQTSELNNIGFSVWLTS